MWELCRRMLAKRGVHHPNENDNRIVANMIKNTLDRYDGKVVNRMAPIEIAFGRSNDFG
jgi:hypothetical protein